MLLDEDPGSLIRHTISNFNITPDKAALSRVNDSLSTLQESRNLRIRNSESVVRKVSRQLATVSSQHKEMLSSQDSHRHAQEIVELDTKKFRVAKQASELEMESERLEGELHNIRGRLADLDDQGVGGDEMTRRTREADDPTILRLWLYRSLGIELEQDEVGNYNKATINNTRKGDVHVVSIEPKYSRWFYMEYLWEHMKD